MDEQVNFDAIWAVLMYLVILGLLFCLIFSTISYIELRGVIKDCNHDLGKGNWTFTEEHNWVWDSYSCQGINPIYTSNYITTQQSNTISQTCLMNGNQVNCSEINGK